VATSTKSCNSAYFIPENINVSKKASLILTKKNATKRKTLPLLSKFSQ